jgi:hypothetical protein
MTISKRAKRSSRKRMENRKTSRYFQNLLSYAGEVRSMNKKTSNNTAAQTRSRASGRGSGD